MSLTRRSAIMGNLLHCLFLFYDRWQEVAGVLFNRWRHPARSCLLRSVALLVFLARSARARIVAPHLVSAPHDLLHSLGLATARHARLFQFAPFFALEGFFQVIHRRRNMPWRLPVAASGPQHGHTSLGPALANRT